MSSTILLPAVNGFPFGKKKLSSGDRIELNNLTILFEETEDLRAAPTEPLQSSVVLDRLEQKIGPLPYSTQDGETADEWEDRSRRAISFNRLPTTSGDPYAPRRQPTSRENKFKDSHISETGEEKETWYPESNVPQKDEAVITDSYFRRWLIISLVFFLAVIGAWGTVQYINSSKKAAEEEMAATQGVARYRHGSHPMPRSTISIPITTIGPIVNSFKTTSQRSSQIPIASSPREISNSILPNTLTP